MEEEVSSYIPLSVEASFLNVAMLEKEEEANASSLNTMVCKEGASVSIAMLEEEASLSIPVWVDVSHSSILSKYTSAAGPYPRESPTLGTMYLQGAAPVKEEPGEVDHVSLRHLGRVAEVEQLRNAAPVEPNVAVLQIAEDDVLGVHGDGVGDVQLWDAGSLAEVPGLPPIPHAVLHRVSSGLSAANPKALLCSLTMRQ